MPIAHLNIGSNIDKENQIKQALIALKTQFGTLKCSSIYESKAVGFVGDNFYNLGVDINTELSIEALNKCLHDIEDAQGRNRTMAKFSARNIDIDLILYGNIVDKSQRLPRKDILKYPFVLAPLVELNPHALHPMVKTSFQDLWQQSFSDVYLPQHSITFK